MYEFITNFFSIIIKTDNLCFSKAFIVIIPVILVLLGVIFISNYLNKQKLSTNSKAAEPYHELITKENRIACEFGGITLVPGGFPAYYPGMDVKKEKGFILLENGCIMKNEKITGLLCTEDTDWLVKPDFNECPEIAVKFIGDREAKACDFQNKSLLSGPVEGGKSVFTLDSKGCLMKDGKKIGGMICNKKTKWDIGVDLNTCPSNNFE